MSGAPIPGASSGPKLRLQSEVEISGIAQPREWARGAASTAAEGPERYIVLLEDPPLASYRGGIQDLAPTNPRTLGRVKLDSKSAASRAYLGYLDEVHVAALAVIETTIGRPPEVVHRYRHALNGFALVLDEDKAERVRTLPGVSSVQAETVRRTQTDNTPDFLGLTDTGGLWDQGFKGESVVVGVLDSGIWPEHPSFAETSPGDRHVHTNPLGTGNFLGVCDSSDPSYDPTFPCNDKLIGAWDFTGFGPRGSYPHGTASAGVAAGNPLIVVSIPGQTNTGSAPNMSGMAPRANVIAYRGCQYPDYCLTPDLAAAIDQAVADGVDVINYSIGGGSSSDPWTDADSQAFLAANNAGIFVAASAGNLGPGQGTIGGPAADPWVTTVGASTQNRTFPNTVTLGSGQTLTGAGLTGALADTPLVDGEAAGDEYCRFGQLNPGTVTGNIVLCKRGAIRMVDKSLAVQSAGGVGLIVYNGNPDDNDEIISDFFIPSVHVDHADGQALKAYIATATSPSAALGGFGTQTIGPGGDVIAGYSSRGPGLATGDLIKPDITAPGVNVLAGTLSSSQEGGFPEIFQQSQGTSMSAPHIAGIGALLTQAHPSWTPDQIKSAIMTTAFTGVTTDGSTPADPFDKGSGRVDPNGALDAGLVIDETAANYTAANPATGGDPKTLNIPSMVDGKAFGGHTSWTRTVESTLTTSMDWFASFTGDPDWDVDITPSAFTLAPGASQAITLTVDASQAISNTYTYGAWNLVPSASSVPTTTLPIATQVITATSRLELTKTVDKEVALPGDRLNYEIQLTNFGANQSFQIDDPLPADLTFVPGSLTASTGVPNFDGTNVTWTGTLTPGGIDIAPTTSTPGYVPLGTIVAPLSCTQFCNDGGLFFIGLDFFFNGVHYDQLTLSWDGTFEPGSVSSFSSGPSNTNLPDAAIPNNLIAPFWTDLDPSQGGAVYAANLLDSSTGDTYVTIEFNNVPEHNNASRTHTFQYWIQNGTDNISWVYVDLASPLPTNLTVGAENHDGTIGVSYYYNGTGTAPQVGTDLEVFNTGGGSVDISFQADVGSGTDPIVNTATATGGPMPLQAGAATKTCPDTVQKDNLTITGGRIYCARSNLLLGTSFTSTGTSRVTGIAPLIEIVNQTALDGLVVLKNNP
jgi:uncharacterized repeat protein (TIGR01451 family)